MGIPAAIVGGQAILGAGSAYSSVRAQKMESDYKRSQLDLNRQMADISAKDAIDRGEREALALRGRTKRLIGSQRAALAAQGINIESGSAAEVQADTAALGAVDELTIRNNAYREAFGYKAQAISYGGQGAFTGIASNFAQRSTILTAGAQFGSEALGTYSRYKYPRGS